MAESVILTTPITKPSLTTVTIERITVDFLAQSIYVQWQFNDGTAGSASYPTPAPASAPAQPTGATLIHGLNTGNFSVNSLNKLVLQRLLTDGYLTAGAISGTAS